MSIPEIPPRIGELAQKWLKGQITPAELQEFNAWYDQFNDEKLELPADRHYTPEAIQLRMLHSLRRDAGFEEVRSRPISTRRIWLRAAAAVAILMLALALVYYFTSRSKEGLAITPNKVTPSINTDIMPGGNRATLTLADGSVIVLDSAKNGRLAEQGNTTVLKVGDGQLAYNTDFEEAKQVAFNTVSTPKGGQYQVVLPDGSKVWLNAVSSLRFPTYFSGNARNVELTGEAYFEIAKDAARPFHVKVNDMQVEVLGTHFNIMAYANEASITTTLLEGSVRVSVLPVVASGQAAPGNSIVLQPGQQAEMGNQFTGEKARQEITLVQDADTEQAVAWKNGMIQLTSADIPTVMRQIERWYDVEVAYSGAVPSGTLSGKVLRSLTLTQVMKAMELSGVHFSIEGRKIVIRP